MPLHTNGTEMTTQVSTIELTPAIVMRGTNGMASCEMNTSATEMPKASEKRHIWRCTLSGVKESGRRWTIRAPNVVPNRATEMATKAKWYHMVTLKIRVSTISYISVVSVMTNKPASVAGPRPELQR